MSGTGIGQSCRIVSNTATEITIDRQWPTAVPDSTSTFRVVPDGDSVYVASQGSAALAVMSLDGDVWANGKIADYGVVGSMAMWMPGDVGVSFVRHAHCVRHSGDQPNADSGRDWLQGQ